jgi:hypothetical protein
VTGAHTAAGKGKGGVSSFRLRNEFAAVDIALEQVPWGAVLSVTDARTGLTVQLDALEVEALTTLSARDREVLVNRSAGSLRRAHLRAEGGDGA